MALGVSWLSKRERVIALEPCDSGLLGTTLRYPYEVRDAADYFAELPEVAVEAGDFNPATFQRPLRTSWPKQAVAVPQQSQTPRLHTG